MFMGLRKGLIMRKTPGALLILGLVEFFARGVRVVKSVHEFDNAFRGFARLHEGN